MNESIFASIKKMLDLEGTESFDMDIKMNINAALDDLRDGGVGIRGVYVETGEETWEDLLIDIVDLANAKLFVFASVKPIVDGTISGSYLNTLKEAKDKALWRCINYKPYGGTM